MYRLFQDNKNPRPDNGDDEAVNPLPAPFYGDMYVENGVPLQVTVQHAVGDEPSALDDGSAMAYQRQFEDLWRALEQEAIRNGWTHIQPGMLQDAMNNNNNNTNNDDDDDDEDEVTEWGINSIPPNIIDPGYGDVGMPTGRPKVGGPEPGPSSNAGAAAAIGAPISPSASNVRQNEIQKSPAMRASFESSNNQTPIHANYNRWETDNMTGPDWVPTLRGEQHPSRTADNLHDDDIPPPIERPRRLDDDPGPPLAQSTRLKAPPRTAAAAAAVPPAAAAAPKDADDESDAWQTLPSNWAEMDAWQTLPSDWTEERAKFISAGIIKPTKTTNLGIELKANRDGGVEIERIANDGFLFVCGTPLKAGDLITGIKTSKASYTCGHIGGMRKNEIVRLLKKATGRITIIAENPTGNPERIECMTSKPHPEFGTGIFFLSGSPGSKILQIHSVPSNGLFANSLLHRGARVISINGVDCTELDACVATDIVKSAPRYVSIVAHTSEGSSVDYAVDPAAHLRSVPEAEGGERRSSFDVFRRRSGKVSESSDHSPRSVDC